MERKNELEEPKWELGPGPFVFSGCPPSCLGTVQLVNKSPDKVRVRAIQITGLDLKSVKGRGLEQANVSVRLGPHDRLSVSAQLFLDQSTPAGTYSGQLCCGSQREQVLVYVQENWDLRVIPDKLSIRARAGDKVTKLIFLTNRGNMTYSLGKVALVRLEERERTCRSLATSLTEAGKQGHSKFLDRLVHEMAESEVQPATVKIKVEENEVHPSETKEVELEIQLPQELKKNRTYKGRLALKSARLVLEIECTDGSKPTNRRSE